jgi:hypothetical protein
MLQVPIPRKCHEGVGSNQQENGDHA